jgi:hypothetical protein
MNYTFERYFRAHAAKVRCDRGDFVLMGRVLRPMALFHLELLYSALGDDIYLPADGMEFAALEIVSKVCSQERPTLDLGIPDGDEETAAFLLKCAELNLDNEVDRYAEYVDACLHSQPRTTRRKAEGATAEWNAPTSHIVATQIVRQVHGVEFEELLYSWPVSQTYWLFWSLREQVGEFSNIAETDEPVIQTEEEKAREAREERLVREITFQQMKKDHGIVCHEMLKKHADEANRLIALAAAGRLTDELQEVAQ